MGRVCVGRDRGTWDQELASWSRTLRYGPAGLFHGLQPMSGWSWYHNIGHCWLSGPLDLLRMLSYRLRRLGLTRLTGTIEA